MLESDILACGKCQKVFHHLPLFQAHKQICDSAHRDKVPLKHDEEAILKLARDIWKEFLLREMERDPKCKKFCK